MSLEDSVRRALADHAQDVAAEPDIGALVARGTQARRRRRVAIAVSVVATAVIGAIVVGPVLSNTADVAPPVAGTPAPVPTPLETPARAEPRTGNAFFAGSANVPVTYAVPPGWEPLETFAVVKSGADPAPGVGFYDVANLYADGCRRILLDPPVGPTVDDLVTGYRNVPDLAPTPARDVTVDGSSGKRLEFTVPGFDPSGCEESSFGLLQADNAGSNVGQPDHPNLWTDVPNLSYAVLILDVDKTRLAIYISQPPGMSAQDRADVDTIVSSIQIG